LKLLQDGKQKEAISLFNDYICNHIRIEVEKGGSRAEWFSKGIFSIVILFYF